MLRVQIGPASRGWLRALLRDLFEAGLNETAGPGDVRAYERSKMAESGNRDISKTVGRAAGRRRPTLSGFN